MKTRDVIRELMKDGGWKDALACAAMFATLALVWINLYAFGAC